MRTKLKGLISDCRPFRDRLLTGLAVSFFFSCTLFLFAPFELYMSNAEELWFPFARIVPGFLILFAVAFAAAGGMCVALRGRLFDLFVSLLFGATIALYLQGNFLNIDYGTLNGADIPWERYGAYSLFNTGIHACILCVPFLILWVSKTAWRNVLRFLSCVLAAMELSTLGIVYVTKNPQPIEAEYGLTWDGVLDYSRDDNIVVILLDTFDNKLIPPLLEEDPDCLSFLDGFTYYRNTLGTYKFTYPSMTAHMTGQLWFCDGTYTDRSDYLDAAWKHDELFTGLHELGYDSRVLGAWQYLGRARPDLIDNYEFDPQIVTDYPGLIGKMFQFTLFRYLPHVLKPGFWLYTGEFNAYKQLNIYQLLDVYSYDRIREEKLSPTCGKKAFRMYHFAGMHLPYTLSENVTTVDVSEGSMLRQAKGSLRIARELIDQMKRIGVYDCSTVILMADHGTVHDGIPDDAFNPIFFVKRKGETGELKISEAPVWLMDLKATILDAAGSDSYREYGTSVFDLEENQERDRWFWCTHPADENGAGLTEFIVRGDANLYSNWERTGRTWSTDGQELDEE